MSDINAAKDACQRRLEQPGQADADTTEERGGDGDHDEDMAEHFFSKFRQSREQRREEEKRMQKVGGRSGGSVIQLSL